MMNTNHSRTRQAPGIVTVALVGLTVLAGTAGCTITSTPSADARFGDANRMLRAQQIVDANAPARNSGKLAPVDGKIGAQAQKNYVDSYRSKQGTVDAQTGAK